jgi:hypothetical protein
MSTSYRIGNRGTSSSSTESTILKSLLELRSSSSDDDNSSITFWNCQWSPRIVQSLRKLLVREGRIFSTIKFFDCVFNNNNNDDTNTYFAEILNMILVHNVTKSLIIKGRHGNDGKEVLTTTACESSLRSSSLDVSILTALREGISTNTSLRSLRLSISSGLNVPSSTTDVEDDGDTAQWWQGLINNTTLTDLDLSGSYLSQSTVIGLSNALSLNNFLQSLNLSRCYLNDQIISEIVRCIQEHPTLTKLNLSRNYLAKSTTTLAVDAITDLLRSSNNNNNNNNKSVLTSLDLSYQQQPPKRIPKAEDEEENQEEEEDQTLRRQQAIAFANALDALSTNTTLQGINLSGNTGCFVDMRNVKALSSCLISNANLCSVDVSCCDIDTTTNGGIQYLAKHCIPHCSDKLKSLILFNDDGNKNNNEHDFVNLDKSTIEVLATGLQSNTTLVNLGETTSSSNKTSYYVIQHLLNSNRGGRRALRSNDNLPLAAWSYVLARAGNIEYDDDDTIDVDSSSTFSTAAAEATSASVLFELIRGPALLERR